MKLISIKYLFISILALVRAADGKQQMDSVIDMDDDVLKRLLKNSNKSSMTYEHTRNYIVITNNEDFVTLFPNGGSFEDFIFAQLFGGMSIYGSYGCSGIGTNCAMFQGSSSIQSGNVYDPSSIELVNEPQGVVAGPTRFQFAGRRQPRFVPDGDQFYFFHGECVATSAVTTPVIGIEITPGTEVSFEQPIITSHTCQLNLCLGGGGFDCIAIYAGSAFVFNLGEASTSNAFNVNNGEPLSFEGPPLPPPFPGTIIGGTGSFEGIEGTVNIATVAGTTGGLFLGMGTVVFGKIVQVISVKSNIPLPPGP